MVSVKASGESARTLGRNRELVAELAGVKEMHLGEDTAKPANAAVSVIDDGTEVYVHDIIDPQAERKRLEKQKGQIEGAMKPVAAKLGNENFLAKAKPAVVTQAKEKLASLQEQLATVDKHLSELGR